MAAVSPFDAPHDDAHSWVCRTVMLVSRWYAITKGGTEPLGYARRSVIGRVMDEGCQGASQARSMPPATYIAEDVLALDKLIAQLPKEMREAVVLDQRRDLGVRDICTKLHCRPQEFHRMKDWSYGWLAARIASGSLT